MIHPKKNVLAWLIAPVVLATCVACGGGAGADGEAAAAVYDKAASLTGQEQIDYLVDTAKEEGGVLRLYTSLSESNVPAISEAFEAAYGIKVEAYRAAPEEVATRVNSESGVEFDEPADVIEARGVEMEALGKQDLVRALGGSSLANFPEEYAFDAWTADRLVMITGCWNTDEVATNELPASLEELAEPQWKGRFALEFHDENWFATMYEHLQDQGMPDDEVEALFEKIGANGAAVEGHTKMQELIGFGEHPYSPDCYTYVTETQEEAGTPTAWEPALEPVVAQPNGVGLNPVSKHPATAALFYLWLLTDGQEVLADLGNNVPTEAFPHKVIPQDIEASAEWRERWQAIVHHE